MLVASGPILGSRPVGTRPFRIVTPVALIGLSVPFGRPDRQSFDRPSSRRWVPSGGGRALKSLPCRPAVPTGSLRSSARLPIGIAPAGMLPCRAFRSWNILPKQGRRPLRPRCGEPVSDSAPLAASAVHRAGSEEPARRVFQRRQRASPSHLGLKISYLYQDISPSREGRFQPFDTERLRLWTESCKAIR